MIGAISSWLSRFGVVMSVVALPLFVLGYRERELASLRRFERWARGCFALTLLSSALMAGCVAWMLTEAIAAAAGSASLAMGDIAQLPLVVLGPLLLPLTAWLGLVMVRRSRAASS